MNKTRIYLIEALIGLGATLIIVVALGLYMLNEQNRITSAQASVLGTQLDDAMTLYAQNCSVCHGLNGEGIGATPALNNPALVTMAYDDLYKTIARGRYQTAMPAWSVEDGGALTDYQIGELVALIQDGDWKATGERVVNLGLAPLIPFTTEADATLLAQLASLSNGATLQSAVTLYASNCVACHGADGLGSAIAPALNDTVVRAKTVDELTRTVTYGSAGTLMAGWSNALTADEIAALVTLVQRWDEVPAGIIPAPNVPIPTTAESIALGSQLYATNCSRCHGPEGQGTPRAPSLNVKSLLTSTSDQALQQIITSGVPGTAMPAWGDRMTDSDIQAIVGFIRQWEATAPEVATPLRTGGGGPPWLRSNTTTQSSTGAQPSTITGSGSTQSNQGGGPPWKQTTPTQQTIDWQILALIGVTLAIAFTLISMGLSALRKKR